MSQGVLYVLQGSLLFRRAVTTGCGGSAALAQRGAIQGFSPRSGARMRRYLRSCVPSYSVMVTLTYPGNFPTDGRTVKRHLDSFVKRAFRYLGAEGSPVPRSIFWFLEFQKRGAPHFHLFLNFTVPFNLVAQWWFEIVGSGDDRHLCAGTRTEALYSGRHGTVSYASKYAAKLEQKDVPQNFVNLGRFWGVYGDRRCLAASIFFPVEMMKRAVFVEFRHELTLILKVHRQNLGKIWNRGFSSGVYMKQDVIAEEVKLLFLRYSMKLVLETGRFDLYEHPTLGVPMESVHELPSTARPM